MAQVASRNRYVLNCPKRRACIVRKSAMVDAALQGDVDGTGRLHICYVWPRWAPEKFRSMAFKKSVLGSHQ